MSKSLPEISKQIRSEDIRSLIEKNFVTIMPVWAPLQLAWVNNVYRTFRDYEKFMIVMHLLMQTFEAYSKNFVKLNYDEYFDQNEVEIKSVNVMEISKSLNIPKETARRKINELEEMGAIKRLNKKIIIDRNTWPNIKPQETIKRMTRFLSTLSKMCVVEGLISETISSENLAKTCKEYFSFIWQLYYEMQIPMLLGFKKVFGDLESFHVSGIVIINHALNSKKNDNSEMSNEFYLEKYFFADQKDEVGINAMSISDITGIPRATVIRKLNKLLKENFLKIDDKKHYSSTGVYQKEILNVQKITLNNLSKLAARIYNLNLMKDN
ncbi:DeoR family transcriptional regulator [Candidatus Pelagibacter sp. Uisw_134_02]|uniref:DeoR family transcriptional regulator n=1 Tax=Candidatus Pelagibacter sp. Uisw_134_02 TaxID=3230990 RepID=UPI0039E73A06